MSRHKVLVVNVLSALATTLFAVLTFWLGSAEQLPVGALLGLSAGFLLNIAMSDIIPTIHDTAPKNRLFDIRPLLLLVSVLIVGISVQHAHGNIDTGHDDHSTGKHCVREESESCLPEPDNH